MPRHEDERPLMRTRVRQVSTGSLADLVAAGDEVDVKGTRPPADRAHPAARLLGRLAPVKDGPGGQPAVREQHSVQVVRLVGPAHRAGLEHAGDGHGRNPGAGGQGVDPGLQVRQPVAEVAAQCEHDLAGRAGRRRRAGRSPPVMSGPAGSSR